MRLLYYNIFHNQNWHQQWQPHNRQVSRAPQTHCISRNNTHFFLHSTMMWISWSGWKFEDGAGRMCNFPRFGTRRLPAADKYPRESSTQFSGLKTQLEIHSFIPCPRAINNIWLNLARSSFYLYLIHHPELFAIILLPFSFSQFHSLAQKHEQKNKSHTKMTWVSYDIWIECRYFDKYGNLISKL